MEDDKKERGKFKAVSPELVEVLVSVLIKIIGESIKDRLIRAILIGVVSAAGSFVSIDIATDITPAVVQK